MTTPLIAGLALVVATLALGWQIVSWLQSGPRIQVQLEEIRHGSGSWSDPAFQGAYAITVANRGRQAVDIQEVRLRYRKKWREEFYHYLDIEWGASIDSARSASLPASLNPGGSIIVYAAHDEVRSQMKQRNVEFYHLIPQTRIGLRWVEGELNGARNATRSEIESS